MKLGFSIDRTIGVPPYLQIVEQVTQSLYTGRLNIGDHLPSVSEVVKTAAVNANTVMKAYRELEYHGVVKAQQGLGTVVVKLPADADPGMMQAYHLKLETVISQARKDGVGWDPLQHLAATIIRELRAKEQGDCQDDHN